MNILIVDDQPQRYEGLIARLSLLGVDRSQIQLVSCVRDAQEQLSTSKYDLLILDVLLPLWPESSEIDPSHSLDLLFELTESDTLIKPGHVVGITGDLDVAKEVGPKFTEATWTVIEYSNSSEGWVQQLESCVKYIQAKESSQDTVPSNGVDLAIVCALAKPELEEILKLEWNWSSARPIDDTIFVHDGWFECNGAKITVAIATMPRMGMVSAALRTERIIATLHPKMMAMTGICAGVKERVKMGDVLFADSAWDYQAGKRILESGMSKLSIAPDQISADQVVRSHVQQLSGDSEAMAKIWRDFGSDAIGVPAIHLGPVASGSAVLADGSELDKIRLQHREVIGVEMEIYGMYSAAATASAPSPKVFALKSVCDFADPEKADGAQRYAAYTSARVLELLMTRFGDRLFA